MNHKNQTDALSIIIIFPFAFSILYLSSMKPRHFFIYATVLTITFFNTNSSKAQQKSQSSSSAKANIDTSGGQFYEFVDQEAVPEGGHQGLLKYIAEHVAYPKMAMESNIQGTVYLGVIINSDGRIGKITVLKGIGGGCDEEAVRVIQSMPRWKPAMMNGKPVNYRVTIPVKFVLK